MSLTSKPSIIVGAAALLAFASQVSASEIALKGAELGKWTMDYDAAVKLAAEKNLPILLNFTGSDWCGWCKLMDKNVYAKPAWQAYATKNILTVTIDFPQDKTIVPQGYADRNRKLSEQFGIEGYPTYVILDSDGATVLGQLGAGEDKTPESFIAEVDDVLRYRPANIEAKVTALGAEKGAQFRAALTSWREAEKALMDWLQTAPKRNPENDKKFEAFKTGIDAAKAKVDAF